MESRGKTVSYLPSVKDFTSYTGNGRGKRVLVVGSGCAGLGAAWHLNRAGWEVTLAESDSRFGGHAFTVNGKSRRMSCKTSSILIKLAIVSIHND
jgi:heterodisulfide reductase subunit A-like polyferredoxin